MVVFCAFLFLGRSEVGNGLVESFKLGQNLRELNGTHLLCNDFFVLIEEEHFGCRIDIECRPEIQAFQVCDTSIDQARGAVLGVDQGVVTDVDPCIEFLFSDVFLPWLWLEVVANGENLQTPWLPFVVDALEFGHFFFAVSACAFPNAHQSVFGVDAVEIHPRVLVKVRERDVGRPVAAQGVLQIVGAVEDLLQLFIVEPIDKAGAVVGVDQFHKDLVHAHDFGRLTGVRHVVEHVLEHVLVVGFQGFCNKALASTIMVSGICGSTLAQ